MKKTNVSSTSGKFFMKLTLLSVADVAVDLYIALVLMYGINWFIMPFTEFTSIPYLAAVGMIYLSHLIKISNKSLAEFAIENSAFETAKVEDTIVGLLINKMISTTFTFGLLSFLNLFM